jgi:1-deoxy-D-xylulose-5-phosphate reductoisomerase
VTIAPTGATTRPIVVLGATGSVGRQTLEIAAHLDIPVVGLAARQPGARLAALAAEHPDAQVVATGGSRGERDAFRREVGDRARFGSDEACALAATPGAVVVNGIVGIAGLRATLAALEAGNRLALANKESLVAAGTLVRDAARRGGGMLLPVDSEHDALFQLLDGRPAEHVARLVLTASGGPFRGRSRESLVDVTPAEALAHPTWDMGRRISVDSATLANKGLEVIEAHHLFGVPFDAIDVVVHPGSVVHGLVELVDGAVLAHLGPTDMRITIQHAITHPDRTRSPVPPLPLAGLRLEFGEPDHATFPALGLAYEAGRTGGSAPAVYNAADEVAVAAFLAGRLGFLGIAEVVERTLDSLPARPLERLDDVLSVDREARGLASSLLGGAC